jgi:hypothetical protein
MKTQFSEQGCSMQADLGLPRRPPPETQKTFASSTVKDICNYYIMQQIMCRLSYFELLLLKQDINNGGPLPRAPPAPPKLFSLVGGGSGCFVRTSHFLVFSHKKKHTHTRSREGGAPGGRSQQQEERSRRGGNRNGEARRRMSERGELGAEPAEHRRTFERTTTILSTIVSISTIFYIIYYAI